MNVYTLRLSILAQLLVDMPYCLEENDFQPLLQLLVDYQHTIQYPIQIKILTSISRSLLEQRKRMTNAKVLNEQFCQELWSKIADTAYKTSASNAAILCENTRLLQLLIKHCHIHLSSSFVTSVLGTYMSPAIRKSNECVSLVCTIFRNVNLQKLGIAHELRKQALIWIHPIFEPAELLQIIMNNTTVRLQLVAELSALCVLSNIDGTVCEGTESDPYKQKNDFDQFVHNLKESLLYKCVKKIIVNEVPKTDLSTKFSVTARPLSYELKSVIHKDYLLLLLETLRPMYDIIEKAVNTHKGVVALAESLALHVHILDQLLSYHSIDQDRLNKIFLTKKILLQCDQIEMTIKNDLRNSQLSSNDVMVFLEKLTAVFDEHLHPMLQQLLRSCAIPATLSWIRSHTKGDTDYVKPSLNIELRTFENLKFHQKIRYRAFMLLAYFGDSGVNGCRAFAGIKEFEFNFSLNTDLLILSHLIDVS